MKDIGFTLRKAQRQNNPDYHYQKGFEECKRRVLEILKKDWAGLDLSVNSCDRYYIDKVKEL